ncbi:Carbohydrate binding domain protein [Phycisphaerae bacterium RAS1]|nr:Carbohydrate binding domain protein [Phycisphaerae bacterium RAS1]
MMAVALLLAACTPALYARQNIVKNGSYERGPGPGGVNQGLAEDWTFFGGTSVERSNQANFTSGGGWSLKVFGGETTVGAFQDVACAEGQNVTISAQLFTLGTDRITGDAEAKIKIEFYDSGDMPVGTATEVTVLNDLSTADTWTPGSIGPTAAPPGAAKARMTCVWTFTTTGMGSAYWDACSLTINGGANLLLNPDFEIPGTSTGVNPTGIDNWLGFGWQEKSTEQMRTGGFGAKIRVGGDTNAEYSGLYQDTADLEAGDRIYTSCYVRHPATGGLSSTAAAAIKLEFSPAGGLVIPPPVENLAFDDTSPTNTWTLVTVSATVPTGITQARCTLINFDTSDVNGPVYMDYATAERSSQPGTNQLLNRSFESGGSGINGLTNWTEFRGIGSRAAKNSFEITAFDPPSIAGSVVKYTGQTAGLTQDITVVPGEMLTFTVYCYSRSDLPYADPNAVAGPKIEWRAGGVPGQIDINGAPNNTANSGNTPADTWKRLWIDFTMPPGSAARVRTTIILAKNGATDAAVYFEDFEAVVTNLFTGSDVDGDGNEDLLDFAELQRVYTGTPGPVFLPWNLFTFDHDEDFDVDASDVTIFLNNFNGPN